MEFQCTEDCPTSLLTAVIVFVAVAGPGFYLARWRRWAPLAWIPVTFLIAGPILSSGFGIASRDWLALGSAWVIVALGARPSSRSAGVTTHSEQKFWSID